MEGLEKVTKSNLSDQGLAPMWVVLLVRLVLWAIWLTHDWVFAPVFGRGDGLQDDDGELEELDEKVQSDHTVMSSA